MRTIRLFGLSVATDVPLTTPVTTSNGPADLTYRLTATPLDPEPPGPPLHAEPPVVGGRHFAYVHSTAGGYVLRFTDVADFVLTPEQIACHLRDPDLDWLAELRLLGPVFAFWLEWQGVAALHASCLDLDGAAVAVVGGKHAGKTSFAVAGLRAGHALMSDDITPIEARDGVVVARASFPQLRLWPADVATHVGDPDDFGLAHPYYTKRRIPVGDGGFGRHQPEAQPLRGVYVLEREADLPPGYVRVDALTGAAGLRELLRHSFVASYLDGAGLAAARLARLADLARAVQFRRVTHAADPTVLLDAVRADTTADATHE